jgi:hypothetical protein
MQAFKKKAYTLYYDDEIVLDPFDYMIVTYSYNSTPAGRDLDSATHFANTGTIEDNKIVGCGQSQSAGFGSGPYTTPMLGNQIDTAYLYQPGDDVGNGLGESILINFKNLEQSGISLNDDVKVELYAGWCQAPSPAVTNISITTYTGGTLTIVNQVITSTGTINDQFTKTNIPVLDNIATTCCAQPVALRTHVGTINFNLVTKVAGVTFY